MRHEADASTPHQPQQLPLTTTDASIDGTNMSDITTSTDARIGTRLSARYLIEDRIGHGGMATVYRARDELLGRDVAIKVMHPALAHDPELVDRFRREATSAARLSHPN